MTPADVPGLISLEACVRLAELAGQVPEHLAVVEVGSYQGRSTCHLAQGAKDGLGAHVWAVDPWDLPGERWSSAKLTKFTSPKTRKRFHRHVEACGLTDRITAVREFGATAGHNWQGPPVGLLYIDGDHTEAGVRADWEAWRPHLAPGAVVVFDDYNDLHHHRGVRMVVDTIAELRPISHEHGRLAVGRMPCRRP